MLNKVILIGRLTKDPEVRTTPSGVPVGSFTLAVNRTFTSANGEREADFINCVCFRKLAENVGRYVHKGSLVSVEGRIQSRSYDAQDGTKRYVTEVICDNVVFLETRSQQSEGQNNYSYNQQQQPTMNMNQNRYNNNNNPMNNPYSNNNNNYGNNNNYNNNNDHSQRNNDDFFNNNDNIDISEDDLPF
jgi:single-strand DNA-binding protein